MDDKKATVRLLAADLHRLVYNGKLLQVGAHARPLTLSFATSHMVASTDDDHVYLQDLAMLTEDSPVWLRAQHRDLPPASVKAVELALRDVPDQTEVEMIFSAQKMTVCGLTVDSTFQTFGPRLRGIINDLDYMEHEHPQRFALRPEYMRKLSLVKPGDYPLDCKLVQHKVYDELLLVKVGPTCRVAVTTMDRENLGDRVDADEILW